MAVCSSLSRWNKGSVCPLLLSVDLLYHWCSRNPKGLFPRPFYQCQVKSSCANLHLTPGLNAYLCCTWSAVSAGGPKQAVPAFKQVAWHLTDLCQPTKTHFLLISSECVRLNSCLCRQTEQFLKVSHSFVASNWISLKLKFVSCTHVCAQILNCLTRRVEWWKNTCAKNSSLPR